MAIEDNYIPVNELGNGVTVNFGATWPIFAAAYIRVYLEDVLTGVQVLQVKDTDYSLVFSDAGFTVTFFVAPTSAKYVVIGRSIALDQTNPYKTSKGFDGAKIEASYDKLTGMVQDLDDARQRSLVFPLGDTTSITLPSAALRANLALLFDAAGAPYAGAIGSGATAISAAMTPVVTAATLADARTAMGLGSIATLNSVANTNLSQMAANTVKVNATNASATPTDLALAASNLLGRGSSGNIAAITLNPGLDMSGGVLRGKLVQRVRTELRTVSTGTTTIPLDDTVPTNSEGTEMLTAAPFTPTNAASKLLIEFDINASNSISDQILWGLFQDSGSAAIDAGGSPVGGASMQKVRGRYEMTAGSTSATTFRVRLGSPTAGTITVNGIGGTRRFGGVAVSHITITEYLP